MEASKKNPIYTVYAVSGGTKYDLTPTVESISFAEQKKQMAKSATIDVANVRVGTFLMTDILQVRDRVYIYADAKKTHLFDKCRVSASDYASFIRGAQGRETYDIVFLDPPYEGGFLSASLEKLLDAGLYSVGAHIVCECDTEITSRRTRVKKDEELSREAVLKEVFDGNEALMERYTMLRTAVYGRTRITLLTPAVEE